MSISIDKILDEFKDINYAYNDSSKFDTLKRMLNEAVEPVHGEWIEEYDGFDFNATCSRCGGEALIKEGGSHDHAYSRYCPNCGAVMDGKEKKDGQIK